MRADYFFLKGYTDLVNQHIDADTLDDLFLMLKDRAAFSDYEAYFGNDRLSDTEKMGAIDLLAQEMAKNDGAVEQIFPDANSMLIKGTLNALSASILRNDVCKISRGFYSPAAYEDEGLSLLEKATLEKFVGLHRRHDIAGALSEYQKLFKAGLASPAEILTLHRAEPQNSEYHAAVEKASLMESPPLVVGGPASVELVDKQGHLITVEALADAFEDFMRNIRTRNIQVLHSNVQCGWALPVYINENGDVYKSGVDNKQLWLIAELRSDGPIAKRVRDAVEDGKLRSYSIAGSATSIQPMQKGSDSFMQVNSLQLAEVTLCEQGVNQGAHFDILKSPDDCACNAPVVDVDALAKSLPSSLQFPSYGVVLERGKKTTAVICADGPNSLTDAIMLELRKALPSSVGIEVRNIPEGDWESLYSFELSSLEKQDALGTFAQVNYRPAESEKAECHICVYFSEGYCTLLHSPVEPEYVCDRFSEMPGGAEAERWAEVANKPYEMTEKALDQLLGFVTAGMSDGSRVIMPGFQIAKESKMSDTKDFLDWDKAEKIRRDRLKEILEEQGIPAEVEPGEEAEEDSATEKFIDKLKQMTSG